MVTDHSECKLLSREDAPKLLEERCMLSIRILSHKVFDLAVTTGDVLLRTKEALSTCLGYNHLVLTLPSYVVYLREGLSLWTHPSQVVPYLLCTTSLLVCSGNKWQRPAGFLAPCLQLVPRATEHSRIDVSTYNRGPWGFPCLL